MNGLKSMELGQSDNRNMAMTFGFQSCELRRCSGSFLKPEILLCQKGQTEGSPGVGSLRSVRIPKLQPIGGHAVQMTNLVRQNGAAGVSDAPFLVITDH